MGQRAGMYIKTRKFLLKPKAMPKLQTLPLSLQRLIQRTQQQCRTDLAFCERCLTDTAFIQQTVLAPAAQQLSPPQLTQGIQAIQTVANNQFFHELYPRQFLQLYLRMGPLFDQLRQESPDAFQETSLKAIKANILNAKTPWLQEWKDYQVKAKELAPTASVWAPFRTFAVAEEEYSFRSRTLWAAVINQYFAYRNNIIRDATLQLLSSYLIDSSIVRRTELIHFFQTDVFSRDLIRSLFQRLTKDLTAQFSGWEGVRPTWALFLNELRQIRNQVCEALSDEQLYAALQTYLEPSTRKTSAQRIVESFQAEAMKQEKTLPAYLVDVLMRKVKYRLRQQVKIVWDRYFRQQRKPQPLTGIKRFIYDFLTQFVQTLPDYAQYTHRQLWEMLQDPHSRQNRLIHQLEKARPLFEALIEQIDFPQVAHQSIEAMIETAYVMTSTGSNTKIVIPHKQKVFRAIHRATPLRTFQLAPQGDPTLADRAVLQTCLEEFLQGRLQRRTEELIRPTLVEPLLGTLQEVLANPTHFKNRPPEFHSPGISLAIADKQMYDLDLSKHEFKLVLATPPKALRTHTTWFTFTIQDTVKPHARKRQKSPRLAAFLDNGWTAKNPTLAYRGSQLYLHIPFAKDDPPKAPAKLPVGKRPKEVEEIVIGVDLNVGTYAAVSVMHTHSRYQLTPTGQITRQVIREKSQELAHYYINDVEALDVKFNPATGTFNNGQQTRTGFVKRKSTYRRGKGKLRWLRKHIRRTQAQVNQVNRVQPTTYETLPVYHVASRQLSLLWDKANHILLTVAQSVGAKLRDITCYYTAQYPHLPIRVQVEDLRWSQHGARHQVGSYLAHNQILFFHSQIQNRLAHLLREQAISVWRVNPRGTSQHCAYCGYKGQRRKTSVFTCTSPTHRTPQGKRYTCNADLNAARNIAALPPRSQWPLQT
ncbi:MAG: zinc ribbon domain-containing protein [Candidatus Heimdallarchaeota archaeon]